MSDGVPGRASGERSSVWSLSTAPDGRLLGFHPTKDTWQLLAFDRDGKPSLLLDNTAYRPYFVVSGTGIMYGTTSEDGSLAVVPLKGDGYGSDRFGPSPSGVVLWPDHGTLVVADTSRPYLWTFRVGKDGWLTAKERYYSLRFRPDGSPGATGLTVDRDGRLYAATELGVQVFDPTGRLCGVLSNPVKHERYTIAFAGTDLDHLYLASADRLYARKLKTKGVPPGGLKPAPK